MTKQFALVTTDEKFLHGVFEDDQIAAALNAAEAEARKIIWHQTDPASLEGQTVLIRTPWDYFGRLQEFMTWLRAVDDCATLLNPLSCITATVDKSYLIDMYAKGYPLPETMACPATPEKLRAALQNPAFAEAVIKPCVSGGAVGLHKITASDPATWEHLDTLDPHILQTFLPEVTEGGEISFIFFGGAFSHAIRKRPKPGDIRVQIEWGGTAEEVHPDAALIEQAAAFLDYLPAPTAYARVDVVESQGRLLLMELEVIEPELFLTQVPDGAARFAAALLSS